MIVEPDSSFHAQTRSTNCSRPRSCRDSPSRLQLLLDDDLRRDAGVVGAELPQRVVAAHPVVADQHVHQRLLERVAHVQRAGDVRRRQLDAERRARLGRVRRLEVAARFPDRVPLRLDGVGSKLLASSMTPRAAPRAGLQKLEIVAESAASDRADRRATESAAYAPVTRPRAGMNFSATPLLQ